MCKRLSYPHIYNNPSHTFSPLIRSPPSISIASVASVVDIDRLRCFRHQYPSPPLLPFRTILSHAAVESYFTFIPLLYDIIASVHRLHINHRRILSLTLPDSLSLSLSHVAGFSLPRRDLRRAIPPKCRFQIHNLYVSNIYILL